MTRQSMNGGTVAVCMQGVRLVVMAAAFVATLLLPMTAEALSCFFCSKNAQTYPNDFVCAQNCTGIGNSCSLRYDAQCCQPGWTFVDGMCCPDASTCASQCCAGGEVCVNGACGKPASGCQGEKCSCDGLAVGDPVHIARGNSILDVGDIEVAGAISTFTFKRFYDSSAEAWLTGAMMSGVPKPFGESPSKADSLNWWHNLLSFVHDQGTRWALRTPDGRLLLFTPCSTTGCWASPDALSAAAPIRLQKTAAGFIALESDGRRLIFNAPLARLANTVKWHFLSQVDDAQGRTSLELVYGNPSVPGATCQQGANGTGASGWVPFIHSVKVDGASALKFTYSKPTGGTECIIASVQRVDGSGTAGGGAGVAYGYVGGLPGLIASATYADGRVGSYGYASSSFTQSLPDNGVVVHSYSFSRVAGATAPGEQLQFDYLQTETASCATGSQCCGEIPVPRQVSLLSAQRGDGQSGNPGLTVRYEMLGNSGSSTGPKIYRKLEACTAKAADGGEGPCSPGDVRYEWTCGTPTVPAYLAAVKDKRGNWTAYEQVAVTTVAGTQLELTKLSVGASDKAGALALGEVRFEYGYGVDGAQRLDKSWRESVITQNSDAGTKNLYDASGRQWGKIQYGKRVLLNGTSEDAFVGIFAYPCESPVGGQCSAPDVLGRTLARHGPCFAQSLNSTHCDKGGSYPVTRYSYHPSGTGGGGQTVYKGCPELWVRPFWRPPSAATT